MISTVFVKDSEAKLQHEIITMGERIGNEEDIKTSAMQSSHIDFIHSFIKKPKRNKEAGGQEEDENVGSGDEEHRGNRI